MNDEFMDDLGDMVFTIGVVAALGLATVTLAVQITHERALLDATRGGHENVSTMTSEGGAARHQAQFMSDREFIIK
jgi:hypothetical protein